MAPSNRHVPAAGRAALSLVLPAMLVCVPVHAQDLQQLHSVARLYDASVQSAQSQLQAGIARADQARAGLLPQVGLTANATRSNLDLTVGPASSSRDFNVLSGSVNASQPLYRPANQLALEQGLKGAEVAQVQLSAAEQDLMVRLAQAYFDVLAARDTLTFVRAQKAAVSQQLEAAQRNFDIGNATITDTREAQARFDLTRAQEIAADNDLQVKRLALEQLVGQTGIEPHPLAQPVALPSLRPSDVNVWVEQATQSHPSVAQSRLALEVAQLETAKAKTGHLPTVDLQASLGQTRYPQGNPSVASAPTANYRNTTAAVGVQLNWPLFAGFAVENRVRETVALEEKARADLNQAIRTVSQATRAAFFGVQSGMGQVKALEAAEASSQTALDANRIGYQVGVRINIDVLNAQSQLYQTKRDLARARYDVLVGGLRLKQVAGQLSENDLAAINQLVTH